MPGDKYRTMADEEKKEQVFDAARRLSSWITRDNFEAVYPGLKDAPVPELAAKVEKLSIELHSGRQTINDAVDRPRKKTPTKRTKNNPSQKTPEAETALTQSTPAQRLPRPNNVPSIIDPNMNIPAVRETGQVDANTTTLDEDASG